MNADGARHGRANSEAGAPVEATAGLRADYIRRIVDAATPLSPQQCDQLGRLKRSGGLAEPEMASLEERLAS